MVYDSFGQVTIAANPDFDFCFGYTGRERDEATGLMYYRARYYDPAVGRSLSEDPIGFDAGDANLYRYVFNSPSNYTDPTGMAALVLLGAGKAIKVIGGGAAVKALGGGAGAKAVDGAGAVAIGAGGLLILNNPSSREALEDAAQWCWETVTGGYNPDLDPNRPNRDRPIPLAIDWGEILQAPPMNPEDFIPQGFGEGDG
ncbi:MAG: RHS repeat-associated core domain-containing protein [Leptolyngbya sp. SIOISBB]|nr:RHS repeat-associated core domain-containing protein [Leptolyngbya sp. SIOISBB]